MKALQTLKILLIIPFLVNGKCTEGEIYSLASQQCQPCSNNCSSCFNLSQDQCITCPPNSYQSYLNTSTCVSQCSQGEIQDQSQKCIQCSVAGCIKCDSNQTCLECSINLMIDQENNKCILKSDVCQSQLDYIYYPFTPNQCIQSCPSSYYQNQNTQICEKNIQCIQIYSSSPQLSQRVTQIATFKQSYYFVRANQCNFALADINFNIIYVQILQNYTNYEYNYMYNGNEQQQKSFIIGEYGGCSFSKSITVMNFITQQTVFVKSGLDYEYFVLYIDTQNQIVFFTTTETQKILWYDAINYQLSSQIFNQQPIYGMFQMQNDNQTFYYFQLKDSNFAVAVLKEDRSLTFLDEILILPSSLSILNGFQNNENFIEYQKLYYIDSNNYNQNLNIFTKNDINNIKSFYIYDANQIFVKQAIGVLQVQHSLQNLQKNPMLNTRLMQLEMGDNLSLYDAIQVLNNQYLIFSKIVGQQVYEYVVDITFLNNCQPLIQNSKNNNFMSLNSFLILNDDQMVYLSQNSDSLSILYLLQFQSAQIIELYRFGQWVFPWFYSINASYLPIYSFNDIIYLYLNYQQCQPFSISQKKFVYQLATIKVDTTQYPSINYQKTGEIFIFYQSLVYIYKYDLSSYYQINLQVFYPKPSNLYQILTYNERYVFYYDQNYFYTFDMELKQIAMINAFTDANLYGYTFTSLQQFDFYTLDKNKIYIKKSKSIIDTNNMLVVKNIQENSKYLGNVTIDENTQIYCFQSQNGIFWHQNIFNNPFNVFNISQQQIVQDSQLQNNTIAIYDTQFKQLIILNIIKSTKQIQNILFDQSFDLTMTVTDWDQISFIFIQKEKIFLQNPNNPQPKLISTLDSNIVNYQYCFKQKIIVAKTSNLKMYTISIDSLATINLPVGNYIDELYFYLKCEEDMIVVYYPVIFMFDLKTGYFLSQFYSVIGLDMFKTNTQQMVPLVSKQNSLYIIFYNQNFNVFTKDNYQSITYLFDYRQSDTSLFYDFNNNILLGITGTLKQINIINIPGNNQLYTYQTISQFSKNAVYYYNKKNSLIIVDNTPTIYMCNYLTNNITTYYIEIKQVQGVLVDENKDFVFIYSNLYILTFKFPSMQFVESISLQSYNDTNILQIYLNTYQSLLVVQTSSHIICFDLTEVLYASETSLLQYQKMQNLVLNQQFYVSQSIINLSLNLYKNTQLIDTIQFEPSQYNISPYLSQIILMKDDIFFYIEYDILNIVQADLQMQKLIQIQQINLISIPDSYFYDQLRNQIFLLYQKNLQLNYLDLNQKNTQELNLIHFSNGDISQSLICSNYIILPSANTIQIYDFVQKQNYLVNFSDNSIIKLIIKQQRKVVSSFSTNWWNGPFDYEERCNNNDSQLQNEKNIFVVINQNDQITIQVINLDSQQIQFSYQDQYIKITNILCDSFRQLLYVVSNQGYTLVFSYTLNLLTTIQNPCLKQAIISYDSDFVYSICPNDIIIYNGLSFLQQYPLINQGIEEAVNFVNTKYNNYFVVIQKNKFSIIKLDYISKYQLIYEANSSYQQLLSMEISQDNNQQTYLKLLLSSYQNTQYSIIPLSNNQLCYLSIQSQNRTLEQIFTNQYLLKSFQSLKNANQNISQIEIQYIDGQCIQNIDFNNIGNLQIDKTYSITLVSQSDSQLSDICWQDSSNYSQQIQNFYLKNMNLQILNTIQLNQNNNMKSFQMFNMTLRVQQSLVLQNYERVLFQNIVFENQNISSIIIQNCQLVIIEQIQFRNISSQQQSIFSLINNNHVMILKVNISNANLANIFQIQSNQILDITDFQIIESNQTQVFQISQSNSLQINRFQIQKVQFSQIFNILGSKQTQISQIMVANSTQVQTISIKPFEQSNLLFQSESFNLQNFNFTDSTDITINAEVKYALITQMQFKQLQFTKNCFSITALQLVINNTNIQNSRIIDNNIKQSLIQIINYVNCTIQNINSFNNQIAILFINQQNQTGNTQIQSSQFSGFDLQNSLVELINIDNLILNKVQVNNNLVHDDTFASTIIIKQCNKVQILDSLFQNNTNSNGTAGSIYAIENIFISIQSTKFLKNKCIFSNGGALSIINTIEVGNLIIQNSQFIENNSQYSTGGAINLVNSNMVMKNSTISNNKALIGGGIYYQKIIPDFILDIQNGIDNGNIIYENQGSIFGNNYGSIIRSVKIELNDIQTPKNSLLQEIDKSKILIKQIKSGDQISFKNIKLLDEENKPMKENFNNYNLFSSDIQVMIQQLSVQLQWDQTDQQIQCIGELQSKQFLGQGFELSAQVMYKPLSQMNLQILSNIFPQLLTAEGKVFLQQSQLYYNITIQFEDCQLGQIIKQEGNSIICQDCPEEGYMGPLCLSCDSYGQIWKKRYSDIFNSGKCYSCENSNWSKLIGYYIKRAEILYLGSTLIQSDKPQIISKILTDHIQILSLLCSFSSNIPNYFKIPFQVSSGSSNITTCIFIYFYFFPMSVTLLSRSLNCIQIGDKKYLDLDFTTKCYDPVYHKPYILLYSLPLLALWVIVVPLFLFFKIKKGKQNKWSIIVEMKQLVKYLKNNSILNQESLSQQLNNQNTQPLSMFSPKSQQQTNRFVLQSNSGDTNRQLFKKIDSIKSIRDKWSYYSRIKNSSPFNKKQNLENSEKQNINNNEENVFESRRVYNTSNTEEFELNTELYSSNHKIQSQFTKMK
ncbi:hypothetical protein ABPG73_018841 [Tetrahymena malaccensis]